MKKQNRVLSALTIAANHADVVERMKGELEAWQQSMLPFENHRMPWVVLHELSHAYHDQVLGFDDARVEALWKKFRDSGKYQSVLTSPGYMREHYGLTNAKEFFAEMTEAYFGSNDFYPFVTGELKQAEPEVFKLLEEIWRPLPGRTQPKPKSKP